MTTTAKVVTGFIVGATTGALMGVLFAPKKGVKTRAMIANKASQMSEGLSNGYQKVKSTLGIGEKANKALAEN